MSNVPTSFTTKKQTVLPIRNLRGKPYLDVAHRLVWFEEENPRYDIATQFVEIDDAHTIVNVTVIVIDDGGKVTRKVTATKRETKEGFADHTEKAQTGALGRALAMLGYGTQFTSDELEEGERLADAPTGQAKKVSTAKLAAAVAVANGATDELGATGTGNASVATLNTSNGNGTARPSFKSRTTVSTTKNEEIL